MSVTTIPDAQGGVFPGVVVSSVPHHVKSYFSEEASAGIPFGVLVIEGAADDGALLVDDGTNDPAGVVTHSHRYNKTSELDTDGIQPDAELGVLREGVIYVLSEEAVVKGGAVRVRHAGAGQVGAFRTTAVANETVPLVGAEYEASSGIGVAKIKITGPLSFGTPDV